MSVQCGMRQSECEAQIDSDLPPGLARLKTCWWEQDAVTGAVEYGLATDQNTLEQAFRLVHDQYVVRGYMAPCASGWRLNLQNALPTTRVFVARIGRRVIATVTLIPDSPLGLPMSEIYDEELQALREAGRELGEVSGLAVDPEYKRAGIAILLRLVRMMVIYSAKVARLSDLCIAVNPHHAMLYRNVFHFQDVGPVKPYQKVNGAPAVALRLNLDVARAMIRELKEGHPQVGAVYGFMFGDEICRAVVAKLTAELERATFSREHFEYFFRRHFALLEATPADREYILSLHAVCPLPAPSARAWRASRSLLDFGSVELSRLALAPAS
jgi:hypothetical protein